MALGASLKIARERTLAKRVITDFIGYELPTSIVDPDDNKATQVILARSKKPEQVGLIRRLAQLIEEPAEPPSPKKELLPPALSLAKVSITKPGKR